MLKNAAQERGINFTYMPIFIKVNTIWVFYFAVIYLLLTRRVAILVRLPREPPAAHSPWQIPSNLCLLRPTWVHNPNGKSVRSAAFYADHGSVLSGMSFALTNSISIASTGFVGLISMKDSQTNQETNQHTAHATRSVTVCRIYVRSTAMRPS